MKEGWEHRFWRGLDRVMRRVVIPGIVALLLFIVGVQIGIAHGRALEEMVWKTRTASYRDAKPGKPVIDTPLMLRCTTGAAPERWTQVDAEAALHYARMSLETARHYGGSMSHKQAFALEAIAGYLDVLICGFTVAPK